ncbi:hypothetical protein L1987_53793 [Smallanthus sonchifolius]|uniref:Uncharacterized protein n=1 Tax=Smallanthus sonchifolius TaxID=185202 RepID=A0ACB9EWV5_9ASTR|nr:hypothetical protein L1987_53793 [Smallanthus sonchifolius]
MDKPPTSYFNGNRSFSDTLLGRQGVLKVGKTVAVEDHANALSGLHGRALVINAIGSSVGKVVFNPNRPDEDDDLSYDYMGVLVGDVTTSDTATEDCEVNVDTPMHEGNAVNEPVVDTPEKDTLSGTEVSVTGKPGMETIKDINEGINFPIIDNNCGGETPIILEDLSEKQDFIPGNVFDFDADCHTDGVLDEEDVFGLDQLLGLDKDKEPFSSAHGDPQDLDLNSQPCIEPLPEHFSVDLDRTLSWILDKAKDLENKWAKISDRLQCVDNVKQLSWEWKSVPSTHQQVVELFDLLNNIHNLEWRGGVDCWKWTEDKDGQFTVASAKRLMSSNSLGDGSLGIRWKGWVPLKCKILVWRVTRNRIPTIAELIKRGVSIQHTGCSLCQDDMETTLHLFTGCIYSHEVWFRIEDWCKLSHNFMFDIPDLFQMSESQSLSKESKYILRGIVYTTIWMLWNERNERVFNDKKRKPIQIVENIKATAYFWIRNRSRWKSIDWKTWCNFPLD